MDANFIDTLEKIAKAWQLPVVQLLVNNARKKKLVSSQRLLNSFDSSVQKEISSHLVTIGFAFEEYGRYHDMKRLRWSALPPIEDFIEWVKEKGINNFRDPNPRPGKTTERRLNEIAWGIAKNKIKTQKHKRRPWFQNSFYKQLNALQEELLLGVGDRTIEQIKDSINSRIENGAIGVFF